MPIYKLKLLEYEPGCTAGMVVLAGSEEEARAEASQYPGAEGTAAWLDASMTTCTEVSPEGPTGVVLIDQWEGG